jgi:hypothetical protein
MSQRLRLLALGLLAVAVALAFGLHRGADAQLPHVAKARAPHAVAPAPSRTIYPDGGSDGPP